MLLIVPILTRVVVRVVVVLKRKREFFFFKQQLPEQLPVSKLCFLQHKANKTLGLGENRRLNSESYIASELVRLSGVDTMQCFDCVAGYATL